MSVATVGFGVAGWVSERRWYYLRGALTLVLACWAWFSWADVSLLEAYSLPPAIVAGAVGWFVRRQREAAGSWLSYGPALVVGFVPSLFEALDNGGVRALILVGAGVAAVLLGAANRLQSPLVVGATVIAAIAIDTLWPVALRVPRWAAIGGAGIVFLWLGATAERRLSQLRGLAKQYESLG